MLWVARSPEAAGEHVDGIGHLSSTVGVHLLGITVSMRVMSAGDGYEYLLRTVAAAHGDRVTLNSAHSLPRRGRCPVGVQRQVRWTGPFSG